MSVNAILAVDKNYGIGYENNLPWPFSKKDMKWFSDNTRGHVVVMGRATWESLGSKPLPMRTNVVISNREIENADLVVSGDVSEIIERLSKEYSGQYIWIIGGANIYEQALPYCDKLYLTTMKGTYITDTKVSKRQISKFRKVIHREEDDDLIIEIRGR